MLTLMKKTRQEIGAVMKSIEQRGEVDVKKLKDVCKDLDEEIDKCDQETGQ